MTSTTIRVPRELHDRLAQHADRAGTTLAGAIAQALDAEDRAAFWSAAAAVMAGVGSPPAAPSTGAESLNGTLKDGLDPAESWADVW